MRVFLPVSAARHFVISGVYSLHVLYVRGASQLVDEDFIVYAQTWVSVVTQKPCSL